MSGSTSRTMSAAAVTAAVDRNIAHTIWRANQMGSYQAAVTPTGHQALGRDRNPGPAAALAQPIVTDEAVLQVSPGEQRQAPDLDPRNALLQRSLGCKNHDRPENESAVRGAGEPSRRSAAGGAHAVAGSVFGMNRMKRFAATIVPARKANVAVRP